MEQFFLIVYLIILAIGLVEGVIWLYWHKYAQRLAAFAAQAGLQACDPSSGYYLQGVYRGHSVRLTAIYSPQTNARNYHPRYNRGAGFERYYTVWTIEPLKNASHAYLYVTHTPNNRVSSDIGKPLHMPLKNVVTKISDTLADNLFYSYAAKDDQLRFTIQSLNTHPVFLFTTLDLACDIADIID